MLEGFEEVSDRDFYEKVMASETPSVVLFADPNSPATEDFVKLLKPYIEQYGDKVKFYYMDVTKNTSFEDFGVFNFPSAMYFRDTMELDRHDFVPPPEMVEQAIKRLLRLS
ncbi:thioredoxin 1 [Hydrogenivirga caldilitoris]|uniref:Thioredoxin 1 n=1 Tax=Hydrogenivirga caldilitoris TaxID=246264 RepID=A0A497XRK4_9AQUI|nr:thioredoxin family protein [Hydrogenivirga caldilitoris]RLJ71568.1 thioredoxin 1 [Hydrogenivirga caldilitoris]